jgi:hypothetical protein
MLLCLSARDWCAAETWTCQFLQGRVCSMCRKSKSGCKSGFQNHQPYGELEDLQSEERLQLGLFFLEDDVKLIQKRLPAKIASIQ